MIKTRQGSYTKTIMIIYGCHFLWIFRTVWSISIYLQNVLSWLSALCWNVFLITFRFPLHIKPTSPSIWGTVLVIARTLIPCPVVFFASSYIEISYWRAIGFLLFLSLHDTQSAACGRGGRRNCGSVHNCTSSLFYSVFFYNKISLVAFIWPSFSFSSRMSVEIANVTIFCSYNWVP